MTEEEVTAIVEVIQELRNHPFIKDVPASVAVVDTTALRLSDVCLDSDESFDRSQFLRDCGM